LLDARNLDTQQGCAGAATAASYIEAFPDLQVSVDHFHVAGDSAFWVWTLTGTNNGPGGTGKKVRVSGIEAWRIGHLALGPTLERVAASAAVTVETTITVTYLS
jgi:hypothetical protein